MTEIASPLASAGGAFPGPTAEDKAVKKCAVCSTGYAGLGKTCSERCRLARRREQAKRYRASLHDRQITAALPIAREWHAGRVDSIESAVKLGQAARLRISPKAMRHACYRVMAGKEE